MSKNSTGSTIAQRVACPVCGYDIGPFNSEARNDHVNACIQKSFAPKNPRPSPGALNSSAPPPPPGASAPTSTFPAPPPPPRSPNSYTPPAPQSTVPNNQPPGLHRSDNPFAVLCPYPRCGQLYEASDFPTHVAWMHAIGPQNYACPICFLTDGVQFVPNARTNLINHLQYNHVDLAMHFPPSAPQLQVSSNPNPAPNRYPQHFPAPPPTASPSSNPLNKPISSSHNPRLSTPGSVTTEKPSSPRRHSVGVSSLAKSPTNTAPHISKEDLLSFKTPTKVVDEPKGTTKATKTPKVKTISGHGKPYILAECLEDSELECPICFVEFSKTQRTARLDCLCFYHEACLDQWFAKKGGKTECPFHPTSKD